MSQETNNDNHRRYQTPMEQIRGELGFERGPDICTDSGQGIRSLSSENAVEEGSASTSFFTFSQLMAADVERPRELVEGLFCERQNVLLMGRFGVGKTMLGTQLTICAASGRSFAGRKILYPMRTAFIDCENDTGDIKDRVQRQTSALGLTEEEEKLLKGNWVYINAGDPTSSLYGMRLDLQRDKGFDALDDFVHKAVPELLVIDNLGLVTAGGDLKEPQEARNFYRNLDRLRAGNDCLQNGAILTMHHLTKPGEAGVQQPSLLTSPYEFISRARGSGRVLDFAQARLALASEDYPNGTFYVVHGINRSAPPDPLILQLNYGTLSFERHDDDNFRFEKAFASSPAKRKIWGLLPEEFTWTDAERLCDPKSGKRINADTLNHTLKMAQREGFLNYDATTRRYRKLVDGA